MEDSQRQNFQTPVWGPMSWTLNHLLALSYPVQPSKKMRRLYAVKIITDFELLMCSKCVENLPENLRKMGIEFKGAMPTVAEFEKTPYLENRETLFYFFFALHNWVNAMLGKRVIPLHKYDVVKGYYQQFAAKCSVNKNIEESGCMDADDGYKPCQSKVVILLRE